MLHLQEVIQNSTVCLNALIGVPEDHLPYLSKQLILLRVLHLDHIKIRENLRLQLLNDTEGLDPSLVNFMRHILHVLKFLENSSKPLIAGSFDQICELTPVLYGLGARSL